MRIKFPLLIIACCLLLMACGHKNTQKNYQAYYSKIGKDQNQFVTFLNEKTFEDNKSHFTDDLNCRRTSFLLLHDLITSSEDLTKLDLPLQNEFIDLKSRHKELTAKDQALYSLLFGDNISYQSTDDLLKAWKKAGLKFPEKVKLLSVFQNGSIYVFEKQDPTLPYRWSRFNNWADIKSHWLSNRFKVFKNNVDILVNDQKFDDFLENALFIPQNNQLAPQDK